MPPSFLFALQLEEILPEDAHQRCEGTTFIAITKVKLYGALRSKRVSSFSNRRDLVKALLASCHLPVLSTGALTTSFRGRRVIDGGVCLPRGEGHLPVSCVAGWLQGQGAGGRKEEDGGGRRVVDREVAG